MGKRDQDKRHAELEEMDALAEPAEEELDFEKPDAQETVTKLADIRDIQESETEEDGELDSEKAGIEDAQDDSGIRDEDDEIEEDAKMDFKEDDSEGDSDEAEDEEKLDFEKEEVKSLKISKTLLIVGLLSLLAGYLGVLGLRLGLVQEYLFGDPNPYPGIGAVEPSGHLVSMIPFVLGLVMVMFWGIRNDPIYNEMEKLKEESAEAEAEPASEEETFDWEEPVPEEPVAPKIKKPLPSKAEPVKAAAPAPMAETHQQKETPPKPVEPKPAAADQFDADSDFLLDDLARAMMDLEPLEVPQEPAPPTTDELEKSRVERCEKMLSVAVVLPEDKEKLKLLIKNGISAQDFTEEVKKAVERRKKREKEKDVTADEKASILEDELVSELAELEDSLEDEGNENDLEDAILKEIEDLEDM